MTTLTAVGQALLVGYLPGWLFFRLPFGNRARRAALTVEERAFWAVLTSAALSLILTLALASAGRYSFFRLLLLDGLVAGALVVFGRTRLAYEGTARRPDWSLLIPLALVATGLWLYFPPAEYVIGGKDPGTYMNEGIQIAQRGSLIVDDAIVANVPADQRNLFFPKHNRSTYWGLRFMGFFIRDPDRGTVIGQFPHLYPASIAIGYGIDGLTGARRASGVWAILGLLAVYFAGTRLLGRTVATAGSALLAINVVQVWFARYPNSEVVMQALLFGALLASARATVDDDGFFAPVAGLLVGLMLFLRYDAVLAVAGLVGGILAGRIARQRVPASFATLVVASLAIWWVYLTNWMTAYAEYPLGFTRTLGWVRVLLLAVFVCGLLAMTVVARRRQIAIRLLDILPVTLVVLVLAAACYGYFIRRGGAGITDYDAASLRTYAWYVTRAGLLMGMLGFAVFVRRNFWRDPATILTITTFGAFFFYKTRIVPAHFWMSRRFLPVILPATVLFAAYAAFRLTMRSAEGSPGVDSRHAWTWPRTPQRLLVSVIVPALLIGGLAAAFVRETSPILEHVEYAGLIPRLERLASRFGERDLLIVESRNASDMHVLALPLAYIYARNVLVLNSPRPDNARFRKFLDDARARYSAIFFMGGGGTDLLSRSIGVAVIESDRFQVPEYESPVNAYPRSIRMKEFDFGIYRFDKPRTGAAWFSLDVGVLDDLNVVRFHAKERMGPDTFRWTRDVSYISIAGMTPEMRLITLWLSDGGRPQTAERAHVDVSLDDRPLGRVEVGTGFRPYSFVIPSEAALAASQRDAPARLRLNVNTWNPRRVLGTPDDRALGVMVDRAEVK